MTECAALPFMTDDVAYLFQNLNHVSI